MSLSFWKEASTRRKRIYTIVAVFILAIIFTALGMFVPLSSQDATTISKDLNNTVSSLKENNALTSYIFGNNFMICLIMFIPVAGPILGFFILFNTGTAISAIATTEGLPPFATFIAQFSTPIIWLEFAAYSTAIAGSIWLFRRILQQRGKYEIRNTCILVAICAIILLIGAYAETAIIALA
jgi:hypothetical protein